MKLPEIIFFDNEPAKLTKYEGYYATKTGYIISVKVKGGQGSINIDKPRYHSIKIDKDGYHEVCLSIKDENGRQKRIYRRVHRIIWETFNGDIPVGLTVDHFDEDKSNNDLSNLRLLTPEDNTSFRHKGSKSPNRLFYKVIYNNSYVGTYDRKDLFDKFGLRKKDFYHKSFRMRVLEKMGYIFEIV